MEDQVSIFKTILHYHFISATDRNLLLEITVDDANVEDISQIKQTERVTRTKKLLEQLVTITVELQEVMKTMFLATPQRAHYVFTMRTLKRLFR